jgi:hypothetical protein
MRDSRIRSLVPLAALLLLLGWMLRIPAAYAWMRHTGGLEPHGSSIGSFSGKPGTILSIFGHTPYIENDHTPAPQVGASHVLVLFSADSLSPAELLPGEWRVEPGIATTSQAQAWRVWSGAPGHEHAVRRVFTTHYNGFLRRVELDGRRYSLADGNLFVVRYDARGRVSVRQLRHTFRGTDWVEIVKVFQALLPSDPAVRGLMDSSTKACPRRGASPARGTAET